MAMAPPQAPSSAATVAPAAPAPLSGEERALALHMEREVLPAFERSRGSEARVDAYLALNAVLRLDDTTASVRMLQRHLPALLLAVEFDLQRATMRDVLHVALRTLSYFVYHAGLASTLDDVQVARALSSVISLLAATQDEATYKLCLWCLTMQNLDPTRHAFLPRIVEALVQAIVNPFKSRAIEVQALKGLHLLVLKWKREMATASAAVLRIWLRPVTSRLNSSDKATRDQVALVLLEAASVAWQWPSEMQAETAAVLIEYALPTMQTHMTHERNQEALLIWRLVLMLMKSQLAKDLTMLNDILYVPEMSMRHTDASVRLLSMEAWQCLVAVFRESKEWMFKKPVLVLLVRPILVCLQEETVSNVLHATLTTWQVIVTSIVIDFNEFCQDHDRSPEAIQQSGKKWKHWVDEVLNKPVILALNQVGKHSEDPGKRAVFEQFGIGLREVFAPCSLGKDPSSPAASSSATTTAGSPDTSLCGRSLAMDLSQCDESLLDDELHGKSSSGSFLDVVPVPSPLRPLCECLLALALTLPDVLGCVLKLSRVVASNPSFELQDRCSLIAFDVWDGFCNRLRYCVREGPHGSQVDKLRHRLIRLCLEFALGISTSSNSAVVDSQAALMQSLQTESLTAADLLASGSKPGASSMFEFRWQLRLLHSLCAVTESKEGFRSLFSHPKSKISQHVINRIDILSARVDSCKALLEHWDKVDADTVNTTRIAFSAKQNAIPCVLLYLLMMFALLLDENPSCSGDYSVPLIQYHGVISAITQCIDSTDKSSTISRFARYVENSCEAACMVVEKGDEIRSSGALLSARLLDICMRTAHRSSESQENAAVLLKLQRSPVKEGIEAKVEQTSTAQSVEDFGEKGESSATTDSNATSPCLLIERPRNPQVDNPVATGPDVEMKPPSSPLPRRDVQESCAAPPRTPTRPSQLLEAGRGSLNTPLRDPSSNSKRQMRTPSSSAQRFPVVIQASSIYPDLVSSSEPISQLFRHFPMAFRPFFAFYKITTVGDLSAMSFDQVKAFGIKEPVATVMKALEEFNSRKARARALSSSPFSKRVRSPLVAESSTTTLPSPRRILKRSSPSFLSPLPLESPQRKRSKRSLRDLSGELDEAEQIVGDDCSTGNDDSDRSSNRVMFRLETKDGETRITRPGEDSQEAATPEDGAEERVMTFTRKLTQYVRRSLHYTEKLVAELESLQSESNSLNQARRLDVILGDTSRANEMVRSLAQQLEKLQQLSTTRCEQFLVKKGSRLPDPDGELDEG